MTQPGIVLHDSSLSLCESHRAVVTKGVNVFMTSVFMTAAREVGGT